jgi:hypothetical protein
MIAELFRLFSGPLDISTKRACMASPRLVVISHLPGHADRGQLFCDER